MTLCGDALDDFEDSAFHLLKVSDDLEEIPRLRVSFRREHAHEDFGRTFQIAAELDEADCAVDVIAQDGLAGLNIAGEQASDRFAQ